MILIQNTSLRSNPAVATLTKAYKAQLAELEERLRQLEEELRKLRVPLAGVA